MANTYNSKNYFAHGGEQLVIGGKLTFLDGAEVENFPGSTSGTAASGTAPYVADSEAATVANLKNDFNALLAALRTYEQAVDNYYCAVSELRATSPDTWPELKPEEQSAFEAGRAVIYGKIQERLNLWANTTDPAAQL